AMAGRIVRYRNRLGGFWSKDQLREVYGITDSVWVILAPQIVLQNAGNQRMLSLNQVDEDSLRIHPYLGAKIARQICVYRKQHPFRSVDEIRLLPLVTEEIYRKIAPYLKL
ncbi:MAG: ComEA family DNA-binding protein, partial [bacterium]